jgi:hypothetical protein
MNRSAGILAGFGVRESKAGEVTSAADPSITGLA